MSAPVASSSDCATGRSVLASLTGHAGDRAALDTAIAIARRGGGRITCFHTRIDAVEATAALEVLFPQVGLLSAMQQMEKEETQRSGRARRVFDEACRRQDVPTDAKRRESVALSLSWKETKSFSDDTLEEARYHDLVVLARDPELHIDRIKTVLMHAGRPLLLAPPKAPEVAGRNIAVAWKESAEAARAVTAAAGLLRGAEHVCILSVSPDGAGRDRISAEKLADTLRWQGVKADILVETPASGSEALALQNMAYGRDCDLLVMGAYGHSRLREFILGGVTREMLSGCAIPVFLFR